MDIRITKARKEARALLRPCKNPIYDTALFVAAATNIRLSFFQAPQGQPLGAANKTEADTNMTLSSALPKPVEADIHGFQLELIGDATNQDIYANYLAFYTRGLFEFFFGQQQAWLQVPVTQIPTGPYLTGTVATANAAGPTAYVFVGNGSGSVRDLYDATYMGEPIPVSPTETFRAIVSWPAAVTSATQHRVRCFLSGIVYQSL